MHYTYIGMYMEFRTVYAQNNAGQLFSRVKRTPPPIGARLTWVLLLPEVIPEDEHVAGRRQVCLRPLAAPPGIVPAQAWTLVEPVAPSAHLVEGRDAAWGNRKMSDLTVSTGGWHWILGN